ncbi:hypothetical protein MLD38_035471 [Melastoma candidum]|uniref:Uncharacterized protein n=1 Tax=Melastoma candidum TaxID=119954 RepID=A0ACB9LHX3_9MYRT|nr:hypothetical protein MLD38_035471 [Melastoma candidum]
MWVALIRVVIVRELISKCAWLLGPRGEDASLLLMVRFAVTGGRRGRGCCGSLLPEGKDVRDCRNVAGEEDLPRNSRSTGGLSFHRPWSRRVARETIWVGAASSSERVLAQIWLKSNSVRFTCGWSCWVPRALRKAGCTIGAAILGEGVRESLSATRSEGSLPPWSIFWNPSPEECCWNIGVKLWPKEGAGTQRRQKPSRVGSRRRKVWPGELGRCRFGRGGHRDASLTRDFCSAVWDGATDPGGCRGASTSWRKTRPSKEMEFKVIENEGKGRRPPWGACSCYEASGMSK